MRIFFLPLIAFYVFPLLVIIVAFQSNDMEWLSAFLIKVIFLGQLDATGGLEVNGLGELVVAVGGWLLIIQCCAFALDWWTERTHRTLNTAKFAWYGLTILYLLSAIAMLFSPRDGSIWSFWAILVIFYGMGWALLRVYQGVVRLPAHF